MDMEGVAIIGMAGRFPGARDLATFWSNLRQGVESITFFTDEELIASGIRPDIVRNPDYVKASGVLEGIELFDASFFDFSPAEAALMDPQQRLFLECAWEALEDAGYDTARYEGWIGVYAGLDMNSYLLHNVLTSRAVMESSDIFSIMAVNDKDFLTTRVSYKLNLRGPSFVVQTACSTSLVAVHLACQGLLAHQCDMALAGGVAIKLTNKSGYLYQPGNISSPDGHCRPFDAAAQGTLGGDGIGLVVLKRLSQALEEGDRIYGVIRGSAINNDGAQKVGFTAPSQEGQAAVIAMAQAVAQVPADSITYVEAHGTATQLGDPVEVAALTQAFRESTDKKGFCALGSVKSNFGHLGAAAGIAGLLKTVLALEHGELPPSLHFRTPNPGIDFANSPFYVNARLTPWESPFPRRAGVSSFGIGGTNAHVVLEQAPPRAASGPSRPYQLLTLSARSEAALEQATRNLAGFLREQPEVELADVAYTLLVGRRAFPHRRAVVCRDRQQALSLLEGSEDKRIEGRPGSARARSLTFMFPGQGAQYPRMAQALYETEGVFRECVDTCAEQIRPHLGLDLRALLFPPSAADEPEAARRLSQTAFAQPALFVIEYALARLLQSVGLEPRALVGHSLGEYVAACLSGVFTLEDALALVAARGRLVQALPPGAMMTVFLPEAELGQHLDSALSLATTAPGCCVVSGPTEAVSALRERMAHAGVEAREVATSHAFHSAMMEPAMQRLEAHVSRLPLKPPSIPFVSNVTGTWITAEQATDPAYWARQLRATVRLEESFGALLAEPEQAFLEVGPGRSLSALLKRHPALGASHLHLPLLPVADSPRHAALESWMTALGRLWAHGARVEAKALFEGERRHRISLPTYPFERKRHWIEYGSQELRLRSAEAGRAAQSPLQAHAWRQAVTPASARPGVHKPRVLLLSAASGAGARLVPLLRDLGYELTHSESQEPRGLLERLHQQGQSPSVIMSAWELDGAEAPGEAALSDTDHPSAAWRRLAALIEALSARPEPVRLLVATRHTLRVTGEERLLDSRRLLPALCEYARQRCPHVATVLVDFPAEPRSLEGEALLAGLLPEIHGGSGAPRVAWRGHRRWEQAPEPLAEEAPRPLAGVMLFAGEPGHGGLALSEQLAASPVSHPVFLTQGAAGSGNRAAIELDLERDGEAIDRREAALVREAALRDYSLYPGFVERMNAVCAVWAWDYMAARIDASSGRAYPREELRRKLKLLPKFTKMFDFLLRMLEQDGFLQCEGEFVRFASRDSGRPDPRALSRQVAADYPDFKGTVRIVQHCASALGEALSNEGEAISVLYPDGTDRFFLECMGENVNASRLEAHKRLVIEVVRRLLERAPSDRKVRILELGAGYGVLSWPLLEQLPAERLLYHFTDVSSAFFPKARQEAERRGLRSMRFGTYDINGDPAAQGLQPGSYDLILGLNVVHVARDLGRTLTNLHALTSPGGLLCLIELARAERWDHLVWGLAPGWWEGEDSFRDGSILLGHEAWEQAMRAQGFSQARAFPVTEAERARSDHAVVLARAAEREAPSGWYSAPLERWADTLDRIRREHGEIRGVIYTPVAPARPEGELAPTLRAVSRELETLRAALAGQPPEFYLLLSETAPGAATPSELALRRWMELWGEAQEGLTCRVRHLHLDAGLSEPALQQLQRLLASGAGADTLSVAGSAANESPRPAAEASILPQREPEAPRYDSPTEEKLAHVFQALLGGTAPAPEVSFFELGGDSLLAVHLMNKVRAELGQSVKMSDFLAEPTVRGLARLLTPQVKPAVRSPDLIPLQARGTQRPIFFANPVGGSPLCYLNLCRVLGEDQPVYGFQPPGFMDDRKPLDRIEQMAAHYVALMREAQPKGPYLLGGWSFGAVIAYEMARLLERDRAQVGLVALLDSGVGPPEGQEHGTRSPLSYAMALKTLALSLKLPTGYEDLASFGRMVGFMFPEKPRPSLGELKPWLQTMRSSLRETPNLLPVYKANLISSIHYKPGPYSGRVTLFKTRPNAFTRFQGPMEEGLRGLVKGGVDVVEIPGNHMTLLDTENVPRLAELLRAAIQRASP